MEIAFADEKAYLLKERLTQDQAQGRAWAKKADAFGTIARFIQRPKDTDITLTYSEKRYEPFWHVVCSARYVYDRRRKYTIPIGGREVQRVTICGRELEVQGGDKPCVIIEGVEHCLEETRKEVFVDAMSGEKRDWAKYLQYESTLIEDVEHFAPEGAIVVPPEVRASSVVREIVGEMMKPVKADSVEEDSVRVENIDLYYKPVFAFEYLWQTKDKHAVIEFDGLTGEIRTGGRAFRQQLGKVLTRDLLFDVGAETLNLIVPGGGLAVKLVQGLTTKES